MDLVEAADSRAGGGVRHPWETARLEVLKRLIAKHVHLTPGAIVVDIGCGDAFVVGNLAAMVPSCTFYGVDTGLTPSLIEATQKRVAPGNLHLAPSLELMTPRPHQPASLVLLMDVIEHVEDDAAFLKTLVAGNLVDAGTCILVTVPAYQWLFSAHDVFLRHYRRYSNRTLRQSLERAGLRVVESSYFFLSLVPLRMLQVIKEKLFGRPQSAASDLMTAHRPASAALLANTLIADASVALALRRVGIIVPGLSNYAICRKSV